MKTNTKKVLKNCPPKTEGSSYLRSSINKLYLLFLVIANSIAIQQQLWKR
jgi:hypothetical protein